MSKSKRSGYEGLDEKKDEIRYEKINTIQIIQIVSSITM